MKRYLNTQEVYLFMTLLMQDMAWPDVVHNTSIIVGRVPTPGNRFFLARSASTDGQHYLDLCANSLFVCKTIPLNKDTIKKFNYFLKLLKNTFNFFRKTPRAF